MTEPKAFTNWKVALLCFIGAATFWFFSALGKEYSYRFKYPITFVYDTDSLVAVKPLPKYVDIDVSGGGWDLFKESFWFGADPVQFDLENPAAIRYLTRPTILPIVTDRLGQFRLNFLFTDTLFIDINQKTSKLVKLDLDSTLISLDEGYRIISRIVIEPDTARIFGPTSFLDTIQKTFYMEVPEKKVDENYSNEVPIGLLDDYDIYSNPPTVNVMFDVEKFNTLVLETEVELISFPEDSSVFIADPKIKLHFVVQESLQEDFFGADFKVIVDYAMINEADSTAPAIVIVQPEQALEVSITPDTLQVYYAR